MHRILIADDDPAIRELVAVTLGEDTYELIYADEGKRAIELAHETKPHAIVLDVNMPVMDGFTVCEELKCDPRTEYIPIVMLTARSGFDDRVAGEKARANAYLTKPFSPFTLVKMIEHLIEVAASSQTPDVG